MIIYYYIYYLFISLNNDTPKSNVVNTSTCALVNYDRDLPIVRLSQ